MKRLQQILVLAIVGVAVVLAASALRPGQAALAQGSTNQGTTQSFESKFWDYLQTVQYRNWAPAAGQGIEAYPGKSPHGDFLKMYVNRIVAADPKNLPHGSIIIKENYDKDKKTLLAITVMYRVKGYDAKHNDWYWVKYNADGTIARTAADMGNTPIAGKVQACIDCHEKAAGGDYYYANDK